ncbi:MAG: pyridoxamine 5'-phosphate oxidase family protein [Micrococcales bacterium]|nr:pyridoxamine 5'-phosphate oxidase family protein [Micrococcales bacterium]
MTEAPISTLSTDDAWELLRSNEFGRLAFHLADEVHITPINYAIDAKDRIVVRTAEGSKLLGLTMNADVAFEVDEVDEHEARSVVVRGRARALEGHEADETEELPLRPWVDTVKLNVVAITVDEVSARRFSLTRPWMHMRPEPD